jgi:hypothetical protein
MRWVNVLKSDQFVHRVVGPFASEEAARRWALATPEGVDWYQCELEEGENRGET